MVDSGKVWSLRDVWNTPSMQPYWHGNDSGEIQVRLTYSNASLLEQMNVRYVEENPAPVGAVKHEALSEEDKKRRTSPFGTFQLTQDGAYLMPYAEVLRGQQIEHRF